MHRILVLPDIRLVQKPDTGDPAGYPVKAGCRISGRIFVLTNIFLVKYKIIFFKSFNNYILKQTYNQAWSSN
jgi:hypothetical protein